jgi:mono/diheme cytochrome c family protein
MTRVLVPLVVMAFFFPGRALADGRTDFNAYCAGCHGAHGNVQTEKAKALGVDVRKLSLKISKLDRAEVTSTIEKGRDGMPSFEKTLTGEQIAGIVDYVMALRKK